MRYNFTTATIAVWLVSAVTLGLFFVGSSWAISLYYFYALQAVWAALILVSFVRLGKKSLMLLLSAPFALYYPWIVGGIVNLCLNTSGGCL